MRVTVSCVVVTAMCLTSIALAEQIGGPSGPERGELRIGAEGNFRDGLEGTAREVGGSGTEPLALSTHTFYGVVQYGITDRLSIRGKGGIGKIGADAYASMPVVPRDLSDLDYGLAWAAGLQFQICAPEEHGTSLALSGQFARMTPDDTAEPTTGDFFSDAEVTEITGALTVGVPHGRTRPYAGVVYSGLEYDLRVNAEPWTYEKPDHVGAVAGLDQVLGDRGWLNLEARFFDESSFSAILGLSW